MTNAARCEIWCDIKGYEGLYQISNFGNVRGLDREVAQGRYGRTRLIPSQRITPTDNGHGYLIVGLCRRSKRKNFYVHRLVAEHFLKQDPALRYVNHKDFDTYNNQVSNLEWCTQKENILHSADNMRKPHKSWKVSGTGEKYIYRRYGGFRLSIKLDRYCCPCSMDFRRGLFRYFVRYRECGHG